MSEDDSEHPAAEFNLRVAELLDDDGQVAGHLYVIAQMTWMITGHLWWRRESDPSPAIEFWEQIGDEFVDPLLIQEFDATGFAEVTEALQGARWQPYLDDETPHPRSFEIRWVPTDREQEVAVSVFGVDLARERSEYAAREAKRAGS